MKFFCGLETSIREFTSWVQLGRMHMVMWTLAVDAYCSVTVAESFISHVALAGLGIPGLMAIVVILSSLFLVSMNDPDLGI